MIQTGGMPWFTGRGSEVDEDRPGLLDWDSIPYGRAWDPQALVSGYGAGLWPHCLPD